jgi:hypothetical protein
MEKIHDINAGALQEQGRELLPQDHIGIKVTVQ